MLIKRLLKVDWMACWSSKNHARVIGMHQAHRQPPNPRYNCYLQTRYQSLLEKKTESSTLEGPGEGRRVKYIKLLPNPLSLRGTTRK